MTAQQAAQNMLDHCGFFVVCFSVERALGPSRSRIVDEKVEGEILAGSYVLTGSASEDDYLMQCKILGFAPIDQKRRFMYRAVAE